MVLGIGAFCLGLLTGLPAIVLAVLALRDIGRSGGRLGGKGAAVAGLVCSGLGIFFSGVIGLLMIPAYQRVREAEMRAKDSNNLKQIGIAMHAMSDMTNSFPAAAAYRTRDGRPGLSWRVAILPYIEQEGLWRQFKLDEPWDSPNNLPLLQRMPRVYQQPGNETSDGTTFYQAFVGPGAAFEGPLQGGGPPPGPIALPTRGTRMTDFTDGTSNTILIATADRAVPWTKPEDLPFDPNGPVPPLNKRFRAGANVVMADGSVRPIRHDISQQTLRALITRAGGEVVGGDW
jgi:prepilin-type processing-associated H-X9-DG protein